MGIIVPAIIPTSKEDLEEKLSQLQGLCEEVQVDIVDGKYARPASWPYTVEASEPSRMLAEGEMLPYAGEIGFEIDLMSTDPESVAGVWIELGAKRLTIHAESTRYLRRFLENARTMFGHDAGFASNFLSLGLAIGTETDLSLIDPFIDRIDYVQFMGIRTIGHQGEPFSPGVLIRIVAFRKKYPNIPVQVDGGVTLANAPSLLQAGVSRLVVGSALWKAPNLREQYRAFDALTEEYGIYG